MVGKAEKSVEAGREFYHKATALKSPHAKSRAFRLLNTLEAAGYRDVPAVKEFHKELYEAVQGPIDTTDTYKL